MSGELYSMCDIEHLLPPLSTEERDALEADMLAHGCLDPILVWQNVIIDGYHRYHIATKHNIPFATKKLAFESVDDAKEWVIRHQAGRRNLTPYARTVIALALKADIAAHAKTHQGARNDLASTEAESSQSTRDQVAEIAGVSRDTVSRIEYIEANADAHTRKKLRRGDKNVSVNAVYTKLKDKQNLQDNIWQNSARCSETPTKTEDIADAQWEPKEDSRALVALPQVSRGLPDPLVGAIFDLFSSEYRRAFLQAYMARFAQTEGKENATLFFVQVAQRIR